MGDRRGLGLVAPAHLDRHDRLAELQCAVGQRDEALRTLEPLDEQDDRGRVRIVQGVGKVVADVQDDLGPAADDPAEADPGARVDEGIRHGTRLRDTGDAAAWQMWRHVADVGGAVGGEVHDPHAVGPHQRDPVSAGDLGHFLLHGRRRGPTLHDAATRDDHRRDSRRGRVPGDHRGAQRVQRHEGDVRALRQSVEARIARLAVELGVLRVDEVAAGRALHHPQVVADGLGDPAPRRCADDRDGPRREQRPQVDGARLSRPTRIGRPAGTRRRQPTTRPTPRFSIARATMTRWISDVPSQIRSTRSSRKNRSAGNSRM